jgi:F-type H+-transporting ATPase subunit a
MDVHIELAAETLFEIGPVHFTNSMFTMFLVMAGTLIVFSLIARRASVVPGRGQGVVELIVEFLLGLVEGTAGRRVGRRIFPLISGIFIFLLFANLSGVLPGVGTIVLEKDDEGYHAAETVHTDEAATGEAGEIADAAVGDTEGVDDEPADVEHTTGAVAATAVDNDDGHYGAAIPILRPPTADLNMTLAMSLLTFVVVQVAGISMHGVGGRIRHMADPPFLFPIEVISELSRIISLAARLFGNVFAGEVLLGVMYAMVNAIKIALIPVLFPVLFIGMEVLFGTIQALVFAVLTIIYIVLATAGHDDHEHEEHHVDEVAPVTTHGATAPPPGRAA